MVVPVISSAPLGAQLETPGSLKDGHTCLLAQRKTLVLSKGEKIGAGGFVSYISTLPMQLANTSSPIVSRLFCYGTWNWTCSRTQTRPCVLAREASSHPTRSLGPEDSAWPSYDSRHIRIRQNRTF